MKTAAFLLTVLSIIPLCASAQTFQPINEKYSCATLPNGGTVILLNGSEPGSYAITTSKAGLTDLKKQRTALQQKAARLKDVEAALRQGKFDRKDKTTLVAILIDLFQGKPENINDRKARQVLIDRAQAEIVSQLLTVKASIVTMSRCAQDVRPPSKVARYGSYITAQVTPVIITAAAKWENREGYVGYLLTVIQDKIIRNEDGRKVGTRSGYLACAKNRTDDTPGALYRIFDDQPCEESEGGASGGNTSLPYADLDQCKAAVGTKRWGSFAVVSTLSFPTTQQLLDAKAQLLANVVPLYDVVILADKFDGTGVSLDEFKRWCANDF